MPQAAFGAGGGVGAQGPQHDQHMCLGSQAQPAQHTRSTRPAALQPEEPEGRTSSSSGGSRLGAKATTGMGGPTGGGASPPAAMRPRRGWAASVAMGLALIVAAAAGLSLCAASAASGASASAAPVGGRALSAPLRLVAERLQELWGPTTLTLWPQNKTVDEEGADSEDEEEELLGITGESHQFAIVIDCGSTGSRMFVYRFLYPGQGVKRSIECISNKKVLPGLSSLADNPSGAGEYMRPLFEHAASVVPREYHGETLVFVQATAGMRLLGAEQQEAIYDSLYEDLSKDASFPFKLLRGNVGTLSGRLEGFYAALSVNYLTGRIDAHLEPHVNMQQEQKEQEQQQAEVELVGALDLGGSSTQIVFQPVAAEEKGADEPLLDESAFWVQSYLAYGVDTIRYRLWSHLTRHVAPDAATVVDNPCGFPGHEEWFKGHRLLGTGQAEECGKEIRRMLWDEEHESCTPNAPCGLDGIRHPPLTGKFLAMSVFFFALDCMKQLGPFDMPHWPSPSIDEIERAAERFCAQDWTELNAQAAGQQHAFTRDDLLPYRCVEVVYIHTLLKHGYGFPGDSRNVTFVLDIEGMEVEWTLGFALSEVPIDKEELERGSHDMEEDRKRERRRQRKAKAKAQQEQEKDTAAHAALEQEAEAAAEGRRRRQHGGAQAEEAAAEAAEGGGEHHHGAPPTAMGEPPRGQAWQQLGFNVLELQRFVELTAAAHPTLRENFLVVALCGLASLVVVLLFVYLRSKDQDLLVGSPCPSPPLSPASNGSGAAAAVAAAGKAKGGKLR